MHEVKNVAALLWPHWKYKICAFAVVVCLHGIFLFSCCTLHLKYPTLKKKAAETQLDFKINIASAQLDKPKNERLKNAIQTDTDLPRVYSASQEYGKYKTTDQLDTRAAPRFEWNVDKSLISRNVLTSLIFTIWVSETGTIDALEPHMLNGNPWSYDNLAKELQTTPMVAASLKSTSVASTMTVELTVSGED